MGTTKGQLLIIFSFLMVSHTLKLPAQNVGDDMVEEMEAITYDYFFEHLRYLASDELKGRRIGTEGYTKAANYVAHEFEQNGLLPYGEDGTYFQEVVLSKPSIKDRSFKLQVEKGPKIIKANYGVDVSVVMNPRYANVNETQNMVFVGYGNIVLEENINDYAGVDVKGKTVIVALGGPRGIKNPVFNDRNAKFDNAISQGARGIILFYPKAGLFQNIILKKVHGFLSNKMRFLADTTIRGAIVEIDLKLPVFAKKRLVKDIMALDGLDLKKELRKFGAGRNGSTEMASVLHCSYELNNDSIVSKNVVALLPGSDTKLRSEYVVLGAHLDGLGVGKTIKGDSIYNGMMDNASGVSALLSISKKFNERPEMSRRSIVFICYTAEENGLLGSTYFANSNNIMDGKMVANLNIDMLSQTFETSDMAPLGYSHSNLSSAADFAASVLALSIDDNKQAELDYIERSDQISFIKKGIPALFVASGFTASDHNKEGGAIFDLWMKNKYHSPFDDLNQEYSGKALLTAVKFNFLTAYYSTNVLDEIKWNTEGWLYKKYVLDLK